MMASAQISLYPQRQKRLSPAIETVRAALVAHGLRLQTGAMSTVVVGEGSVIFAALGEAFAGATAAAGRVVMTVTVSNACPVAD